MLDRVSRIEVMRLRCIYVNLLGVGGVRGVVCWLMTLNTVMHFVYFFSILECFTVLCCTPYNNVIYDYRNESIHTTAHTTH